MEEIVKNDSAHELDIMGMKIESGLVEYEKENFTEINDSFGMFDSLLQGIPTLLHACGESGEVYKVVYDKGLGVLQRSAKNPGYFTGNIVEAGTNNNIKGGVLLQKMSMGPQIVSGVFSVMSMVTGQYYMSQINDKLSAIEGNVADIKQFLENDKRSNLEASVEFLNNMQKQMCYICDNDVQKQATCMSIQKLKIDACSDLIFYRKQIEGMIKRNDNPTKAKDVLQRIQELNATISGYYLALYLYSYASFMEPMVAQNYNENYLESIATDIGNKTEQYIEDLAQWNEYFIKYVNKAKAYDGNKLLEAHRAMMLLSPNPLPIVLVETLIDEIDKNKKSKAKKKVLDILDSTQQKYNNTEPMNMISSNIALLGETYNKPIEMIVDQGKIFVNMK